MSVHSAFWRQQLCVANNLVSFVCSAAFAYAVSQLHFAALRALYHAWYLQFEVSPTLIFASF
jgi:hypothetical protein